MRRIVLSIVLRRSRLPRSRRSSPHRNPRTAAAAAAFRADTAGDVSRLHAADRAQRHGEGQGRETDRGADRQGLRRHREQRAAGNGVRRLPAARGRSPAPGQRPHRRPTVPPRCRLSRPRSAPPFRRRSPRRRPADVQYQNRRLLVLYFDLSSIGQAEQIRAFTNAQKYIDTQMAAADVIAIMTYSGRRRRVKQDFTDDRRALREVIDVLANGEDADGDGESRLRRTSARRSARTTASSTSSTPTGSWRRCRRRSTMLRPLPEQKSLVFFTAGCS